MGPVSAPFGRNSRFAGLLIPPLAAKAGKRGFQAGVEGCRHRSRRFARAPEELDFGGTHELVSPLEPRAGQTEVEIQRLRVGEDEDRRALSAVFVEVVVERCRPGLILLDELSQLPRVSPEVSSLPSWTWNRSTKMTWSDMLSPLPGVSDWTTDLYTVDPPSAEHVGLGEARPVKAGQQLQEVTMGLSAGSTTTVGAGIRVEGGMATFPADPEEGFYDHSGRRKRRQVVRFFSQLSEATSRNAV